ncbi:phospholipid transporting ATPase [Coemansia sp. BCRC 34301]|nr:phospholipid transporting ATPase [Coemansia sp. BCRC 34301]
MSFNGIRVGVEPRGTVADGDGFVTGEMERCEADFAVLAVTRSAQAAVDRGYFLLSEVVTKTSQHAYCVLGQASEWGDSALLSMELQLAAYVGFKRVLAPELSATTDITDYARTLLALVSGRGVQVVVRVRAGEGAWVRWNRVRMLCGHNVHLQVALELSDDACDLPQWRAEPVQLLVLPTHMFITNASGYPVLSRSYQAELKHWMEHAVAYVVRQSAEGVDLVNHVRYLRFLADTLEEPDSASAASAEYRDVLQAPLQPLMDHLESAVYETFEMDLPKYDHYEHAMLRAIQDSAKAELVLMVVGAGRGPLVTRALRAARQAERAVRVIAIEKNPSALVELQRRNAYDWGHKVTLVRADMRGWVPAQRADILVSELLGSFGDNELSPECLDAACHVLLAPGGVCIPQSYTAYVAPLSSTLLHARAQAYGEGHGLETPYVVNIHAARVLAEPQAVWSFHHPQASDKIAPGDNRHNQRKAAAVFCMQSPSLVHGLAGYFDAVLYGNVQLSIRPDTHTKDMHSWFPMYFPIKVSGEVISWINRLFMSPAGRKRLAEAEAAAAGGERRTVYVNIEQPASAADGHVRHYPANQIRTAKYTVVSFVPKNLFEQFRRAANMYFLFLLVLQFVPAVTTGSPGLSALALFTIVFLTMAKDGYEDSKRSASDREANRAPATVLGGGWANTNKPPAHFFRPRGIMRLAWSDSGAGGTVGNSVPNEAAHVSDADIGSDSSALLQTEWRHLHVGDIVLLRDGDSVPGDVLLLSTSDEEGSCFVETKNLDGETNLKAKTALAVTAHLTTSRQLAQFRCAVEAEAPTTQLYSFKGSLQVANEVFPLGIDNLLLRGSVVRNTHWAAGVVLFTGSDTKIMMNAGETPSKRSRIERMMNYQVMSQFCLLFGLCMLSAVLGGVYYGRADSFQAQFIVQYQTSSGRSAPLFGFLTFWTSLILYQTVVPISLYVSIEVVKSFQAYFISQDIDMYYAPLDRRCTPKSWNLSDDLGQVEYIFSDKTGTLTQNVMEFRQCSIRGRVYGEIIVGGDAEAAKAAEMRRQMDAQLAQACEHPYPFRQSQSATFFDTAIYDDLRADSTQARAVIEFFTVLALCHNVVSHSPDPQRPDVVEYKAQSPDEAALVATARDVGFAFLRRERDRVVCSFLGHEQTFTLLATLEFTSARKRMSVIVRRSDGRIMLLSKGADSVILQRIRAGQDRLRQATLDDLELFANHGLRTLCLAYRLLGEDEYAQWRVDYDQAVASLGDRDAEVERACDAIENQLQLIGGTAIEDKLQDGVPETIAQLALAGIKLWVLTGDKTETAINIGYSCNLLNTDMQLIVVNAETHDATREQLERALKEFGDFHADLSFSGGGGGAMSGVAPKGVGAWRRLIRRKEKLPPAKSSAYDMERRHGLRGVWDNVRTRNIPGAASSPLQLKRDAPLALVIDGHSLKYALEPELAPLMLELAVRCQSVLCCRVSPLQKALVVRLVKEGLGTLCLAVGDGANDVSMIQEADVGIGISGEEGLQAVMASDYSIAQFRFLQKLLLVHGRWAYLRITSMVLNFFYKNVVFTVSLFWFQLFCQWSVANFFDYTLIMLYNMLYTSLPPGVLGVFDQDLSAVVGMVVPQLYKRGIYKLEYSMARFWMYIIDGLYQSAAITLLVVYTYYFSSAAQSNGLDSANRDDIGTVGAFCVVLTTNLYMGLNNRSWTWVMPLAQLFGLAMLLGVFFVYGVMYDTVFSSGAAVRIFTQIDFWLLLVLTAVLCLMPHYIAKFVRSAWYPTDTDVVREIVHGFRRRRGRSKKTVAAAMRPSRGMLNYASASPHKEVPFGAFPECKPSLAPAGGGGRQWRQQWRQRQAAAAMDGAIPLDDLTVASSSRVASPRTASNSDPLNRPGVYQGVAYPEADAALISCLHNLAHMGDSAAASATAAPMAATTQPSILKRLSVYQQQRRATRNEDISLHDDGADAQGQQPQRQQRRQSANTVNSVRSSIYYLDDGSIQPYTGYAFAQQEHPPQPSGRGRHLHKRQR